MSTTRASGATRVVWALVVLLAILHWDFWYWDDRTLVLGFLPIGLAYQAGFSLAAAAVWAAAVRFAWPTQLEEWASSPVAPDERPEPVPGERQP
jgi:hypothetical protein